MKFYIRQWAENTLTFTGDFFRLFTAVNIYLACTDLVTWLMPENLKKITTLLLIFLVGAVHLTIDLAHQHSAPSQSNSAPQILPLGLKLQNGPPLCPACLFAQHHQSAPGDLVFFVDWPPPVVVAAMMFPLLPQFQNTPCRNRAPPIGWLNAPLLPFSI